MCPTHGEFPLWLLCDSQASVFWFPKEYSIEHFSLSILLLALKWIVQASRHYELNFVYELKEMGQEPSSWWDYHKSIQPLAAALWDPSHLSIFRTYVYDQREFLEATMCGHLLPFSHRTRAHSQLCFDSFCIHSPVLLSSFPSLPCFLLFLCKFSFEVSLPSHTLSLYLSGFSTLWQLGTLSNLRILA